MNGNGKIVLIHKGKSQVPKKDKVFFEEEEERTMKKNQQIFIHLVGERSYLYSWAMADQKTIRPQTDLYDTNHLPSDFLDLKSYGITASGSKVYFMGGYYLSTGLSSDTIFIFDTQSNSWESSFCMKQKRVFPKVFVYKNKVYIFGYLIAPQEGLVSRPSNQWAEVYDIASHASSYLPSPPQHFKDFAHLGCCPAVDYRQEKVYFCYPGRSLYGYSLKDGNWFDVTPPFERFHYTNPIVNWSRSVVVIRSVVFWHYYGTIYAYDLSEDDFSKQPPAPMCTVPHASQIFLNPGDHFLCNPHTRLFDAGNGLLCLVHTNVRTAGGPRLYYHRFRVRFAPTLNQVDVTHQDTQSLQTEPYIMGSTIQVERADKDKDKDKDKEKKKKKKKKQQKQKKNNGESTETAKAI